VIRIADEATPAKSGIGPTSLDARNLTLTITPLDAAFVVLASAALAAAIARSVAAVRSPRELRQP
jgi:hypothetical protein